MGVAYLASLFALPLPAVAQSAFPPLPPPRPETLAPQTPGPVQPHPEILGPPIPARMKARETLGPPLPPRAKPAEMLGPPLPPRPAPEAKPAEAAPAAPPGPDCLTRLHDRGLVAETAIVPVDPANPACTIAEPVKLSALSLPGGRITFPDQPMIACITAETFTDFVAGFMAPLAKGSYGDSIVSVGTGPGFECRPRDGVKGAKLSAHGQGLAIDIAQFRLSGGRTYHVGDFSEERDHVFDRALRAGACGYFHTALGPGADPSHATHWHMDLEPRGKSGTSRFCQ